LRLGTLAYIPYGPLLDWHDSAQRDALLAAIDATARRHRAAFLKIEPGHDIDVEPLRHAGFRPSAQTIQPPATIIIDLDDEDTMLKRMNQGTRRNIRKSEKFEVVVRQGARADVDSFNAMLDETGERQAFGVHVPRYYERAYDLFVPSGDAVLLMGSYNGLDLAGMFIFKLGGQAWYLYGASRQQEKQRMASFAVQWAGIQWAKQQGCTTYDLYGIPDESEAVLEATFQQRNDGLWGVYRFKRGWGGRVERSIGAWDRIYSRPIYALYQVALRLRGGQGE
jgi:lipid II:glycine glycyltransferase (peptidoglycan interpeptide bridge formation enzyme)